ncbi:hypothetical protein KX816_03360 [Sphingosinicellaceae bacterium]|nr:hypothetical protein KX816_03360 [Sphingosinicellaceae bacterium]
MSVFMQSTLELKAADMAVFTATMNEVVSIVEGEGWHLITAVMQVSGRLHTAIDLWRLDDLNHFQRGLVALQKHPRFAAISKVLGESIERETVVFGVEAPWVPAGR